MPDWTAFGAVTVALTVLVLVLARATQSTLEAPPERSPEGGPTDSGVDNLEPEPVQSGPVEPEPNHRRPELTLESVSTAVLYLNVAGTQALFLFFLLVGILFTRVPLRSLGVAAPTPTELGTGTALGIVLFGLNRTGARLGRQFDIGADEALREALAPETVSGWLVLLFGVLPIVAGFEELLFRGALVGGFAAGFGVPVLVLVVGSSVAFGLGHGAQGWIGVVVTGLLGVALAGAFVATGNLVVVFVAHYLVNALEFVVCEGIRG